MRGLVTSGLEARAAMERVNNGGRAQEHDARTVAAWASDGRLAQCNGEEEACVALPGPSL